MMLKYFGAAATAALLATASQGFAATLLIDDFSNDQRVIDIPGTDEVNNSQAPAASAIGGFRDLQANNFEGKNKATELRVEGGFLSFSNIATATGEGFITYDGDDNPLTVNTNGLNVNLVQGNNPYFQFDVGKFDAELFIEVRLWDLGGKYTFYNETLPAQDDGFVSKLFLSQFENQDFDFTSVGALQFYVQSDITNLDGTLDKISVEASPVPLPAAGLLLLGGVGGLSLLRRRQKA